MRAPTRIRPFVSLLDALRPDVIHVDGPVDPLVELTAQRYCQRTRARLVRADRLRAARHASAGR